MRTVNETIECRFNILGKLSYGALWAKWKPLDDLLKVD